MTRRGDSALQPWIVVMSLGATIGGWALLARQTALSQLSAPQPAPESPAVAQSVGVAFPPIPTVEALRAYAKSPSGAALYLDLPPIPAVVVPAPGPQASSPSAQVEQTSAPSAPATQPQPVPPVATTRSSK